METIKFFKLLDLNLTGLEPENFCKYVFAFIAMKQAKIPEIATFLGCSEHQVYLRIERHKSLVREKNKKYLAFLETVPDFVKNYLTVGYEKSK